ncbi:MAG: hypothetical protein AB8G11_20950 [Saprospiraceae bacterium]
MRFKKSILCTILFTLFLGIGVIDAQVRVVNEDGDVIILMPDNKWKYEDEKKESKRKDKNSPPPKNVVPATNQKPKIKKTTAKSNKSASKGIDTKKAKKTKKTNQKTSKSKKSSDKKSKKTKVDSKKSTKKSSKTTTSSTKKASNKKPKSVTTKPVKQKKQKAMVYSVPKRERKVKAPVIPEQLCEYSMKERDEFTNKLRVATKPQSFFEYTQEDLKKFMREDDYLICTGNLSRVAGLTIFNVKFEIESVMAQQEYGIIEEGTQMMVKLLNEETVILTCQESDKGTVDESDGLTVYRTYFGIDKTDEKMLKKSEVVKVRMLWSTGFEDYDINELDFFINQLKCLDVIKD